MPYKTVRSVLQTRDGYVWAATLDGLARFDGVRFTVFNTANSPGLKTNRLAKMVETFDGSLWISGEEAGSFRLGRAGIFTSVSTTDGLPHNDVRNLYEARDGMLWVATMGGLGNADDWTLLA